MKKYDVILMDADDTLFDFGKAEENALKRLFTMYGIPWTDENVHIYQEINEEMWRQFEKGDISKSDLLDNRFALFFAARGISADGVKANEDYLDGLAEGNFLLPGALELCKAIKELGCSLYLATNGVTRVQKNRLAISEIRPYCDGIFVSEEAGSQKPQKEYFRYVLEKIGNPDKSRVLMVGDSLTSDIKGAVEYGLPCCWLNRKGKTTDLAVTYTVTSVPDILSAVTDNGPTNL